MDFIITNVEYDNEGNENVCYGFDEDIPDGEVDDEDDNDQAVLGPGKLESDDDLDSDDREDLDDDDDNEQE